MFIAFIIGMAYGANELNVKCRREAIERGFAEYNPTNGIWQWKR